MREREKIDTERSVTPCSALLPTRAAEDYAATDDYDSRARLPTSAIDGASRSITGRILRVAAPRPSAARKSCSISRVSPVALLVLFRRTLVSHSTRNTISSPRLFSARQPSAHLLAALISPGTRTIRVRCALVLFKQIRKKENACTRPGFARPEQTLETFPRVVTEAGRERMRG